MTSHSADLLEKLIAIVGAANALTSAADKASYLEETRKIYESASPLVLRPNSVEQVSAIMQLASETKTAIVPQGGNTGHVGGSVANPERSEIILSLSRMNQVRDVDVEGNTMVVEAGVVLETAQQVAHEADRLFPLSIGSKGTCQIGGNLSTNAGGTAVLAYGNARDLVLGLEVVLPNGDIWHGLRRLGKDNTGYDLKNLFIGAEGTLGVITAAVLKLFPKPQSQQVAFVGLNSPHEALELFNLAKGNSGHNLTGFELMPRLALEFVLNHLDGARDPLETSHPWYVLIEISSSSGALEANALLEDLLGKALEAELINDAVLAQSVTQQKQFWNLRESISPSQIPEGGSIKHDISVPVASIPEFLNQAADIVETISPGGRVVAFGHMGDGNIHYNISQPEGANRDEFLSNRLKMNAAIHALVLKFGGSISAEHGIGLMKRDEMARTKDQVELEIMKTIKQSLDPLGIMNPGKVIKP